MKVREVIAALMEYPMDEEVRVTDDDFMDATRNRVVSEVMGGGYDGDYPVIVFGALAGDTNEPCGEDNTVMTVHHFLGGEVVGSTKFLAEADIDYMALRRGEVLEMEGWFNPDPPVVREMVRVSESVVGWASKSAKTDIDYMARKGG